MKSILVLAGALPLFLVTTAATTTTPANAFIHEIVSQACSGQSELQPPGVATFGEPGFAAPIMAINDHAPNPVTTGAGPFFIAADPSPAAKFEPNTITTNLTRATATNQGLLNCANLLP